MPRLRPWQGGAAAGLLLGALAVLLPDRLPPSGASRALPGVLPGDDGLAIAVLGTSLTAGADWPEALRGRLADCTGRAVRLARFARPGAHSGWGVAQVPRVVAARPDIVLVEFTINDADIRDGLSLARSRETHLAMIDGLRAARPGVVIGLLVLNPPRGMRSLTRPFLWRYRALYQDLAEAERLGLLDLDPLWRAAFAKRGAALAPDGLHPTPAAVAEVAQPALSAFVLAAVAPGCPARDG